MYQALYRKWRPQTFDEVVGQGHITETLRNQVITGRLSHAYIFIGTRGTGKTTCARILAKAVNCENPVNGNPCGVCSACRGISAGSVMDIVELDAASNNGVDNVRALREEAVFSPANVKKRVYIIDEVHMLSGPAFNALLKILEEPPEHLMFILATTELHKVPATILSRCQRHSFKRIDVPVIARHLQHVAEGEGFKLDPEAAELIARLAEGGVRDAISLLDQCSGAANIDVDAVYSAMGLAGNRRIVGLLSNILRGSTEAVLNEFNTMWMDGKDPGTVLTELSGLLRDVLVVKVAPKGGSALISGGFDGESLQKFANHMTVEELLCAMDTLQGAIISMREARNTKTAAELCLVSLCDNTAAESLISLRARVSRLEEQLEKGVPLRYEAAAQAPSEEYWEEPPAPASAPWTEEEDEIDPEMFAEEQPEDIISQRAVPAESPVKAENPASEAVGCADAGLWDAICREVKPNLRPDVKYSIDDPAKVRAKVTADAVCIEALPGFVYTSMNRQDTLQALAAAARKLSGREMRVQLTELKNEERAVRSLEELRAHKEVKFIN